jgi:hypothetical protein
MKCISDTEGKKLLEEIHSGICGNHAASRTIVGKASIGILLAYSRADTEDIMRRCKGCHHIARQAHVPTNELNTIPLSWPFACWGLDIIGPLKKAPGGFEWLLVAIDKFTKWIEVLPLVKHSSHKVVDFIESIVHRFGVPHRIITYLGSDLKGARVMRLL